MEEQKIDVFISYSTEDKAVANGVYNTLTESGVKCWVSHISLCPGQDYTAEIAKVIKRCKVVVLIFSAAASQKRWVQVEANMAFSDSKIIIPCRIDNTNIADCEKFRPLLQLAHWIDASGGWEYSLQDLVRAIFMTPGLKPEQETAPEPVQKPAAQTGYGSEPLMEYEEALEMKLLEKLEEKLLKELDELKEEEPEPVKPAPVKPEPVKPEPVKPAPVSPAPKRSGGAVVWVLAAVVLIAIAAGAYYFTSSQPTANDEVVELAQSPAKQPVAEPVSAPKAEPVVQPKPEVKVEPAPEPAPAPKVEEAAPAKPLTMAERRAMERAKRDAAQSNTLTRNESAEVKAIYDKGMQEYRAGDYQSAINYFKRAGEAGHLESCNMLVEIYTKGVGNMDKNLFAAEEWSERAAKLK